MRMSTCAAALVLWMCPWACKILGHLKLPLDLNSYDFMLPETCIILSLFNSLCIKKQAQENCEDLLKVK